MKKKKQTLTGKKTISIAIKNALSKKAENVMVFNPGSKSDIADWIMICEGKNEIQNRAIANAIVHGLKEKDNAPWYNEGMEQGRWILLDYIDVVINIILPEVRAYYELDKLWEGYPKEFISE